MFGPSSPADLALMRVIDELHLEYPFSGGRMLQACRRPRGMLLGPHVATLMKRKGIEALYRRANN